MDEAEESLERERRARADLDKAKRKLEGELKLSQEQVGVTRVATVMSRGTSRWTS